MGKSRLLAELGAGVVAVGARPGDAFVPYALAGRWLRALMTGHALQPDAAQREGTLRLLPELGAAVPSQREQLVAVVEALFAQALQRGLRCTVIDDLQFADAASVALLQALAGRGDCGWIVAMRPAELGEAAQAFVDTMERLASTRSVTLPALDAAAIAELLQSLGLEGLGGAAQAESLRSRTAGNPLFVLETIKAAWARQTAPWRCADRRRPRSTGRWPPACAPDPAAAGAAQRAGFAPGTRLRRGGRAGPELRAGGLGAEPTPDRSRRRVERARDPHRCCATAASRTTSSPKPPRWPRCRRRWRARCTPKWRPGSRRTTAPARVAEHWLAAGEALHASRRS